MDDPGFSVGVGRKPQAIQWGHFVPPPVPSCAFISQEREPHLVHHRKEAKKRQHAVKMEAFDFNDRHGMGGDVDGFRALLRHKYGNAARGWRLAIAPHGDHERHDHGKAGTKATLYSDLCRGLKEVGFAGNAVSLWKSLSNGNTVAWLEDLDPKLAESLDTVAGAIADNYPAANYPGGAWRAWKDLPREHLCRATADEFANFVYDLLGDEPSTGLRIRQVFEGLCISGRGTLTQEELVFLDHWAHRRLGKPLPAPPVKKPTEEVHWSPPPPKPPHVADLQDFRRHLEQKCGSPARGWRVAIDVKAAGTISMAEFGMACRQIGFHHAHQPVYNELVREGGGSANMRGLDPATCGAIDTLIERAATAFGSIFNLWEDVLDPDGDGICSRVEFVTAIAREIGLSGKDAGLVFTVLDVAHSGWISLSELGYLESFMPPPEAEEGEKPSVDSRKSMLTSMSTSTLLPGPSSTILPGRSGRQTDGSWFDASLTSSSWDAVGSGSGSMRLSSRMQAPKAHLGSTQRSSRSMQNRQFQNCILSKYRWQGYAAGSQTRSMREGSAWATLKKEVGPRMPTVGGTPLSDVFRFTNEFYREGVRRLQYHHDLEEAKKREPAQRAGSSQRSGGSSQRRDSQRSSSPEAKKTRSKWQAAAALATKSLRDDEDDEDDDE